MGVQSQASEIEGFCARLYAFSRRLVRKNVFVRSVLKIKVFIVVIKMFCPKTVCDTLSFPLTLHHRSHYCARCPALSPLVVALRPWHGALKNLEGSQVRDGANVGTMASVAFFPGSRRCNPNLFPQHQSRLTTRCALMVDPVDQHLSSVLGFLATTVHCACSRQPVVVFSVPTRCAVDRNGNSAAR